MESEASPIEKTSSFYPSIKKARTLTEWLDVPSTIQTVKTLEQCFADINTQMHPCMEAFMDKEEDSDFNVDMLQPAKGTLPIIDFKALDSELINALGLQFGELTMDGGSDIRSHVKYMSNLYYVNMISFDLLKCEHNKYLSQCAKCTH